MIKSRDNAQVKHWAKLARDARYRRKEGRALIEGPHLVSAFLERGHKPVRLILREGALDNAELKALARKSKLEPVEVAASLFNSIAEAETPQGIAAEIEIPQPAAVKGDCAFLEGVQDAGNVGAIIRSAAAFGISSIVLDSACADPWSPKVLRAGMGGHFGLNIFASKDLSSEVKLFGGKILCTVTSEGVSLRKADLSDRLGWVFGSEGSGISAELRGMGEKIRIPITAGTESLNVAAAAAICFHEAFSRGRRSPP